MVKICIQMGTRTSPPRCQSQTVITAPSLHQELIWGGTDEALGQQPHTKVCRAWHSLQDQLYNEITANFSATT